ncbi:MAG: 30S ribosomal protein S18 [bacterium]
MSEETRERPAYARRNRDDDSRGDSREGGRGERGERGEGGYKSKTAKRKICRFCAENIPVDYRNLRMLRSFVTERAKIVPGRISGTCAQHQRELTAAIKRARQLALLAYTSGHKF